jgi:transcriptional regulator with XRE-family HTH domain
MKRDRIDKLLQLAYLEGEVHTRKAYERAVAARRPTVKVSEASKVALQRRLEQALERSAQQEVPLTVGAFLKSVRSDQSLRPQEIFSRLGISQNIYRMLEQDRISPLRVSAESWKRLRSFFNLSVDELVEMIRRTHQLVFFRPAFRTMLARYDAKKNKKMKASTLEKAATELYTRAQLAVPEDEKARLNTLIKAIGE